MLILLKLLAERKHYDIIARNICYLNYEKLNYLYDNQHKGIKLCIIRKANLKNQRPLILWFSWYLKCVSVRVTSITI